MGCARVESSRVWERDESATTVISQRRNWRFGGGGSVRGDEIFADRAGWIQPRGELDPEVSRGSQPACIGNWCSGDLGADRSRCQCASPRSTLEQSDLSAALYQKPGR